MMIKWIPAFFFAVVFGAPASQAQDVPCSAFCVTGMYLDTITPGQLWVTIEFNSDSGVFINYPHIQSIIDSQGDTIATGSLWFFGQFGGTSADYPVTTDLTTIPANFEATLNFNFDTVTCQLAYPCITGINNVVAGYHGISFDPNPCSTKTTLTADVSLQNASLTLFDMQGQAWHVVDQIYGNRYEITLPLMPAGIYITQVTEYDRVIALQRIVVIH